MNTPRKRAPGGGRKPRAAGPSKSFAVRLSDEERAAVERLAQRWRVEPVDAVRRAIVEADAEEPA